MSRPPRGSRFATWNFPGCRGEIRVAGSGAFLQVRRIPAVQLPDETAGRFPAPCGGEHGKDDVVKLAVLILTPPPCSLAKAAEAGADARKRSDLGEGAAALL
jgi:hypothetical protein